MYWSIFFLNRNTEEQFSDFSITTLKFEITMEELDIKISQMRKSNNSLLGGFIDFINKL